MERLPPEVWNLIIKGVESPNTRNSRATLVALRQANQFLSVLVAPHVFHTIPLWIGSRSLQNLDAISEHAVLSKYVNTIEFSPLQIKGTKPTASSKEDLKRVFDSMFKTINASELGLTQYNGAKARYLKEQSELLGDDHALRVMMRAFRDLPNLHSFHIVIGSRHVGARELSKAFKPLSTLMIDFDCKTVVLMAVKALQGAQKKIESFKVYTASGTDQKVDKKVQDKKLSLLGHEGLTADTLLAVLDAVEIEFLECLEHLTIGLPDAECEHDSEYLSNTVRYVIGQSVNLRTLEIIGTLVPREVNIADLWTPSTTPKLLELSLRSMVFEDQKEVVALFDKHCKSLQRVYLELVRLVHDWESYDAWVAILRGLRELDWVELKVFRFGHWFADIGEVDIAPYLRRESTDMPLKPEDFGGSE